MTKKRRVLIVLGMHRSGTSAMAGALNHSGIPMGDTLMPGRKGENATGFWEDKRIVELHEQLLKELGMSWDDTRFLPDQWWLLQEISEIKSKLKDVISSEFGNLPLWAFKDPRTCRLMPLWHQILNELKIEPLFIHVVRNPIDVEHSLVKRDRFECNKSLLLWFIYNIEAFQATRKYPRVISIYNDLLEDSSSVIQNVFHTLGLDEWVVNLNTKAIGDFVSPKLRHYNIGDKKLKTVPFIFSQLYELCRNQSRDVAENFDKEIDSLAADYSVMAEIFSPWQKLPGEKIDAIQIQKKEIYEQLKGWMTRAEESEKQLSATKTHSKEVEGQLETWQLRAEEVEGQLKAWQLRAGKVKGQLKAWQLRTEEVEGQLEASQLRAEKVEGQLKAWQLRTEEVEGQLEASQLRAEIVEGQLEAWQLRAEIVEGQLKAWQLRAEEVEGQLKAWQLRAEIVEGQLEASQLRAEIVEGQLEASQLRAEERETQLGDLKRRAVEKDEKFISLMNAVKQWHAHPLIRLLIWLRLLREINGLERKRVGKIGKMWSIYKRHGFTELCRQIIKKTSILSVEKKSPLVEKNPDKISYYIDLPKLETQANVIDLLTVAGWACSVSGIKVIDIFIDGVFQAELKTTLERTDVGNVFPNIKKSNESGFSGEIDVSEHREGERELKIVIQDREGNVAVYIRNIQKVNDEFLYHNYYLSSLLKDEQVELMRKNSNNSTRKMSLKIFVLIKNNTINYIETVNSVLEQDTDNWSCDIIIDKARKSEITELIPNELEGNGKIRVTETLNLKEFKNDNLYFCFIQPGEVITKNSLLQWKYYLSQNDVDICYSDNDLVRQDGLHIEPNFKPEWSPDYFLSKNYIGNVFFIKNTSSFQNLFNNQINADLSAWRYELLLKASEKTNSIGHIAKVLWSSLDLDTNTDAVKEVENKYVKEALLRNGVIAEVDTIVNKDIRVIKRSVDDEPKVSIIIPTTGRLDLLAPCLDSILNKTDYKNYELIFIDNGRGKYPEGIKYLAEKGVKILERNEPFNWAKLNNDGAKESKGELFLFLNDDIEVIDESWLKNLVSNAVREDVGSVGAMLLYPDGRIQHGGIFLVDHGGGAMHCLHFLNPEQPTYQGLHQITREVSASTGACLMIKRSIFEEMNGFDEDLAIVGNDVDICLRIHKAGYRNIWTPECRLIHHESVSRKKINITADEEKMWTRWGDDFIKGDPYYNPNLTNTKSDYSLRDLPPSDFEERYYTMSDADKSVPGINLVAYIRAEMGVGEASRSMACAMDRSDIPFCIINYEHGNPSRMMDHSWNHKIVSEPKYDINLFHINADLIPEVIHNLPKKFTKKKYNIGLWAWELPEFPDRWIESFSYLDEIWVPSYFVQQAVMEKSPIPVVTIPHSVRSMNQPYLKRAFFNLPADRFLFLSMYDVHSTRERKNPEGAIDAYKLAFPNITSHTALVVKVNNASEAELTEIQYFIGNRSDIILINRILSRYEVDSLISCCDCFISLHRSEGFGLVIAEAMTLGKPVIATNWSGNQDFMNTENSGCVNYSLTKLEKNYGPYDAGQLWAEPDLDHAASLIKKIFSDKSYRESIGGHASDAMTKKLSPGKVGDIINERINSIMRSDATGGNALGK